MQPTRPGPAAAMGILGGLGDQAAGKSDAESRTEWPRYRPMSTGLSRTWGREGFSTLTMMGLAEASRRAIRGVVFIAPPEGGHFH